VIATFRTNALVVLKLFRVDQLVALGTFDPETTRNMLVGSLIVGWERLKFAPAVENPTHF
jgi:hypothetical protein